MNKFLLQHNVAYPSIWGNRCMFLFQLSHRHTFWNSLWFQNLAGSYWGKYTWWSPSVAEVKP